MPEGIGLVESCQNLVSTAHRDSNGGSDRPPWATGECACGQEAFGHIMLIRLGLEPFREWICSFESPQRRQSAVAPTQCWPSLITQMRSCFRLIARATNGREGIQIFLSRGDRLCFLLCLRETSKFHGTCEWFGPDWTVVRSPVVHVLGRPSCDDM